MMHVMSCVIVACFVGQDGMHWQWFGQASLLHLLIRL